MVFSSTKKLKGKQVKDNRRWDMNDNEFSYLGLLSYNKLSLYIVTEQQWYTTIPIIAIVAHILYVLWASEEHLGIDKPRYAFN
jgi:hypothetical protein